MTDSLNDFDALWDYDRPAETETRLRDLLPAAERNPDVKMQLLTQIARAQGLQRRFEDAHATLEEVETGLPPGALRPRIRYLLERGRVYNSSGDPTRARPYFEKALALAQTKLSEAFYAIDAAHMLAIVVPPGEQLDWNLRALALVESSNDDRARHWLGSLYNNIGWTYHAEGDLLAALEYLERALAFRQETGDAEGTRIARWCVARVRRDMGQIDEALAEQLALLAEYKELGERSGYVFEEIGECLRLLGDDAAAQPYFVDAYAELARDPWLVANESGRLERLRLLGGMAAGDR
jgi:tetratricopeptide (TPR) repeat protein